MGLLYRTDNGALFSPCRKYRYVLWRIWRLGPGSRYVTFVGLNPSTADEHKDDMTITKCKGFAQRLGYDGIYMLNLFAYRTTYPAQLVVEDPCGPDNMAMIEKFTRHGGLIVAAWGTHGTILEEQLNKAYQAQRVLQAIDKPVHCLGVTANGKPRHPSRLPYTAKLVPFWSPYDA